MRAPLSIVIPTLNAAGHLPDTLASLVEGLERGILREVVISDALGPDGQGDAATARLADQSGAVLLTGAPGRGGQLRRGAEAAGGDWLLFLHADTRLAPGWSGAVLRHITQHPASAGWFRLRFSSAGGPAGMVAAWANLRARMGLPFGDQGLLISRALYDRVGGYPDIALMEDMALARALRGRLVALDGAAVTSPERYQKSGWVCQGLQNIWRQIRFMAGADPAKLARSYDRTGRKLR